MTDRRFPITLDNDIKSVPWALMAPHEAQALTNHGRGIEELASRGGLTPEEALAVIEGRAFMRMPFREARERLQEYAAQFETSGLHAQKTFRGVRETAPLKVVVSPSTKSDVVREALELVRAARAIATPSMRHRLNRIEATLERAL